MTEPIFWLALSFLLVAVCLTVVLLAALPVFAELSRAARSAEKLFDTLGRELPPTLEAIRLTGLEISDLTDDISEGVQSAGRVVKQVDQSLDSAKQQVRQASVTTRSVMAGVKAAWQTWNRPTPHRSLSQRRPEALLTESISTPEPEPVASPLVPIPDSSVSNSHLSQNSDTVG